MTPTPNEGSRKAGHCTDTNVPVSADSIVISGMSALMPGCRGLDEFNKKLYDMENLITTEEARWEFHHPEISPYQGMVPTVDDFDAQFFMINLRLARYTDAMSRKLLEQTYQAIIDAGVCPSLLSGKRVGVFVASGHNAGHRYCMDFNSRGLGVLGDSRSMIANRISYWLNTRGPSYHVDASSSGALAALEHARDAIARGLCDAAIVGGARITMYPHYLIQYKRLIPLNHDGKTKCYDMNADGQAMTEAVTTFFLQKYKDARRVYAEIHHIKSNYAASLAEQDNFGFYRDPAKLSTFFRKFYDEAGVSPSSVEYVEGCGAALPDADRAELQAMEEVFCKARSKPLLVGSVTSNMGYADVASGLCGLVKLLLAYQKGILAANLHCDNPRQDISALQDGRMKIVTRHEHFDRSFTALNNFSMTGTNVHLLLKGHYKAKEPARYHTKIPYMLVVSGRQESAVQKVLDNVKHNELDPEAVALLHEIHKARIPQHLARGYGIYETQNQKTVVLSEKTDNYDDARRPLWFVYSGMGSQWAGMGAQLMRIPIFAAAIERCDKVLKPKGVDVLNIITNPDDSVFDSILNSFVGISAIQIGLTDILRAVGLVPDYIIGHSVGELGCAYADGCCTAEETILLSYSRGLVSTQTPFIKGSMAAVGIGYKQISKICPPDIDVACHNGPDSSTISGPVDAMRKFMGDLRSRGIFAKEVRTSNIAYHSRYVAVAGPALLRYSNELIKEPKLRSERWLSTSVQQDSWHEPVAKYSSAEYHTNNLLNPVLFEETLQLVPNGAVLVEVAPHGLLQAILQRSLPADCLNVSLTKRLHNDNTLFVLEALGKLYMVGYDIDIGALYPRIEYPVSTETRQLSHLVEWVHSEEGSFSQHVTSERVNAALYKPIVTLYDEEYEFLKGSVIEGTCVFPLAGALVLVWDTLSMTIGKPLREISVQFHNVKYHKQLVIRRNEALKLVVMMQQGSGRFEVTHKDMLVVEGHIFAAKTHIEVPSTLESVHLNLKASDIYKLLFERGYEYKDDFRSIYDADNLLTKAQLIWQNNWVTFIDGCLQLCTLNHNHDAVSQPKYIKRICIDMNTHTQAVQNFGNKLDGNTSFSLLQASVSIDKNTVRCGGLSVENISFKLIPIRRQQMVLKTLKSVPFFRDENTETSTTLYVFIQIVTEYFGKKDLTIFNIDGTIEVSTFNQINAMISDASIKHIDLIDVKEMDIANIKEVHKRPDVIILNLNSCNVSCNNTGGEYFVPLNKNSKKVNIAALRCSHLGDLDSLYWAEIPNLHHKPREGDVKVGVHYAELNAYDAKRALAQISVRNSSEQGFGIGFSGPTESGEYVMGLAPTGSVYQEIWSSPHFLWPVPTHWSLEDAATVPLAYTIAFYILGTKSRLVPSTKLLVHGGAGALGQAAISIALATGCEVFTTVSNHNKKMFLRNLFPELPENHIGNSRDHTFKDMIMHVTKGQGCNIVMSCAKGLLKNALLSCCAVGGTTFDLVQLHTQENYDLGMYDLIDSRHYVTIDISSILSTKNIGEFKRVRLMLSEGVSRGYVRPLSRVTYAPHDAARAFRLLAASSHRGRVLLRMHEHAKHAQPRLSFSADAWHILLCDKDGFGIYLADKLVERGVRKLCLHFANIPNYLYIKKLLWEKLGVEVKIVSDVLDSVETIRKLFNGGNLEPIKGIYVVATDLMDKETKDKLNTAILNLDVVSREIFPSLRYFTVISEDISIGRDVCQKRKQCNLNSLSLQIKLEKIADNETTDKNTHTGIMWHSASEAIETALLSDEALVLVHSHTLHPHDVLQEVAKLPGVLITSNTDDRTLLRQVGIDEGRDEELCTLLEEKFNIHILKDDIPCMTVGQLKSVKSATMETDKEVAGFGGYFSKIIADEVLASSELVFMPTLTHTSNTSSEEYDDNETYLCIVPGMEGHHERFRILCELLKVPAVVLQLGVDKHRENVQDIAHRLVNVMMNQLKIKSKFCLLGYEFGIPVVLVMATILEKYGLSGTVYCLGGTPNEIHAVLENKLQCMTEETLQIALLQHLHCLILGEKMVDLDTNLRNFPHYSDKVKFCVDSLRGRVPYTSQYIEAYLEIAYWRINLCRHSDTEFNDMRAKTVVIRTKLPQTILNETNAIADKDIIKHELQATLEHAPKDIRCAALINKYLDNDILTKFNKRNLCESYIKNKDDLI